MPHEEELKESGKAVKITGYHIDILDDGTKLLTVLTNRGAGKRYTYDSWADMFDDIVEENPDYRKEKRKALMKVTSTNDEDMEDEDEE